MTSPRRPVTRKLPRLYGTTLLASAPSCESAFLALVETSLSGFNEKDASTYRIVGKTCHHTWWRLIVNSSRTEDWWPNEIFKIRLVYIDKTRGWCGTADDFIGNLLANLVNVVLEGADAGLASVVLNNVVADLATDADVAHVIVEASLFNRFWVQVIVEDVQLLVVSVTRDLNNLHSVENGRVQGA
eukprot:CAMPEP_0185612862 /NCGR_PEP_ID=MMETSP0436-20130131/23863_1 /TAXON_ID=626734 ORGANISM="Favella taraikaensis, Strain Fe Narragansett Bay" /NCGR_SAMPLE_ID=MMETSP0436 /ASSEMBLY_ACC=CAM_ASM_000390 /LENGTH=185 /DNA_ID=CAMNT_0028246537 /DNA_START=508 /DNA_END=1064 /DNA_ORIENTATION=+